LQSFGQFCAVQFSVAVRRKLGRGVSQKAVVAWEMFQATRGCQNLQQIQRQSALEDTGSRSASLNLNGSIWFATLVRKGGVPFVEMLYAAWVDGSPRVSRIAALAV
jgi:hypothetical protein